MKTRLRNEPLTASEIEQRLLQWTAGSELKSVRASKPLAALQEPERQTWKKLWKDVTQLRAKTASKYVEIAKIGNGKLSADARKQTIDVKLSAGKTYVVEMKSEQFNPFLYVQDQDGTVLALNDDITIGKNHNSRLVVTPNQDGNYRIVATAVQPNPTGAFTLTAREFVVPSSTNR